VDVRNQYYVAISNTFTELQRMRVWYSAGIRSDKRSEVQRVYIIAS